MIATVRVEPHIDAAHLEPWSNLGKEILTKPLTFLAFYFVPPLATIGYAEPVDPTLHSQKSSDYDLEKLKSLSALQQAAGIKRKISLYKKLGQEYLGFGGYFSFPFLSPIICVPIHHIQIVDSNIPQEWAISQNNYEFFLAREVANLKWNRAPLTTIIKVSYIAASFFFMHHKMAVYLKVAAVCTIAILMLQTIRWFELCLDKDAVEILSKVEHCGLQNAKKIASDTIEKLKVQNQTRARENKYCSYYINSETGDNWLDLRPALSYRQQRIEAIPDMPLQS